MIGQQFGIQINAMWHEDPPGDPKRNAERYIAAVRKELAAIYSSRAGRALAQAIKYWTGAGQEMLIMPFEGSDENAQEDGATRGSRVSVVLFSPTAGGRTASKTLPGALPREKLHHEMVHGLRRISGHMRNFIARGQMSAYSLTEEAVAIVATNIFISDSTNRFKSGLRFNHEGHSALPEDLADSYRYFRQGLNFFNVIENFCQQNPAYTRALAAVPSRFNPIAAYYKNRNRAFNQAADGDADYLWEAQLPMDYYADGRTFRRIILFDPLKPQTP